MIYAFNIREPVGIYLVEASSLNEAEFILHENGIFENNYQFNKECDKCFIEINSFNEPINEILIHKISLN